MAGPGTANREVVGQHQMELVRTSVMVTFGPSDRGERRRQGGDVRRTRPHVPGEHFNRWLDERLRRLYEAELSDPIPDDMLRLLKEIEGKG